MAGRGTRAKKIVAQAKYKDVATQTSPENSTLELNRLKEEVDLLRQELHEIKKNQQLQSVAENKQQQKEELTVVAVADSPQAQKILPRGCACRGRCSSRACGCVKKQINCTVACKCLHKKCQNKETDKENISSDEVRAKVSSGIEKNPKLLSKSKLREHLEECNAEEAAGPSNKGINQVTKSTNSIFSPDSSVPHGHEISISNLEYNSPIKFGTSKNHDSFKSECASSPKESGELEKKTVKTRLELRVGKSEQKNVRFDASKKKKNKLLQRMNHDKNRILDSPIGLQDIRGSQTPTKNKFAENKVEPKYTSYDSTEAANISEGSEQPELELEMIDPMKPTRQLQRTPVSASLRIDHSRVSELPVPYNDPIEPKKRSIIAPPDGINEPHVNWAEHCAQLVPCRFCTRTFYPFRIETHEASCKRI